MDIFAVEGLNDVLVMGSELNNIYLHCKDDFSSQCLLSNISPFKCISNETSCDIKQYLLPTSKSTQQAIILTEPPTLDIVEQNVFNITNTINNEQNKERESVSSTIRNVFILIICILIILGIKYRCKIREIWNKREIYKICQNIGDNKMCQISDKCKKYRNILRHNESKGIDNNDNETKQDVISKLNNNESRNLLISTDFNLELMMESDIEMTAFNVAK